MWNSVTYPNLRHMLGYTNDQQLHAECHLLTLGVQVLLLISWHERVPWCYEVYLYVTR
jgi:hypothetical protein